MDPRCVKIRKMCKMFSFSNVFRVGLRPFGTVQGGQDAKMSQDSHKMNQNVPKTSQKMPNGPKIGEDECT